MFWHQKRYWQYRETLVLALLITWLALESQPTSRPSPLSNPPFHSLTVLFPGYIVVQREHGEINYILTLIYQSSPKELGQGPLTDRVLPIFFFFLFWLYLIELLCDSKFLPFSTISLVLKYAEYRSYLWRISKLHYTSKSHIYYLKQFTKCDILL